MDASRPPMPADFAARLRELVAAGRLGDAVAYWQAQLGVPAEAIAQMRQLPMWSGLEALALTLPYDAAIMADTQYGTALPLRKWASVAVPTLALDGTTMMGARGRPHRHAPRGTFHGQDHGPAPEALAPALRAFFLG